MTDPTTSVTVFLVVAGLVYFLPTWVAAIRGKRATLAIFVLNLLTGWTLIAWVGALVWALIPDARREWA